MAHRSLKIVDYPGLAQETGEPLLGKRGGGGTVNAQDGTQGISQLSCVPSQGISQLSFAFCTQGKTLTMSTCLVFRLERSQRSRKLWTKSRRLAIYLLAHI